MIKYVETYFITILQKVIILTFSLHNLYKINEIHKNKNVHLILILNYFSKEPRLPDWLERMNQENSNALSREPFEETRSTGANMTLRVSAFKLILEK